MRKKTKNPLAEDWFSRGDADLDVANITLRESQHFALVCFLSQQSAEKYLKGFLTLKNKKFRKTHFLDELVENASRIHKKFSELIPFAKSLDGYYIDTRYPVDWSKTYRRHDAFQALKDANEIIGAIKKAIQRYRSASLG
ncbi:MAG: hypothetical protein A2Y00_06600 [Omnitrophica WOR_2 bacterium GWF2_43_52]|nr:MAG: hypothetical protein A2Y00_06600 [Omnitrophica WOR_2 bacterium GWF2_43_52]OGX56527.1 MAG: hypothetical protein A2460_09605 [Omnitrophica WOR_2 bacterium RIFOXYC2_FULL_43_9]HAH21677.1 hypothetical protein [Candidatus Omnitrophota bacterium]HBG64803.1 hypothetical protein [Candidatus Omnitrophota bacterium]